MTARRECDCCKLQVQTVNELGLCFACDVFHTCTSIIKIETGLSDDEAMDLAHEIEDYSIPSAIIERLMLPGQEHPLVLELLQTMKWREKPN
jgi:hypothetical protein